MHNLLIVFVLLLVLLTLISTFGGSIRPKESYLDPELYVDPPTEQEQEPEGFYAEPEYEGYVDGPDQDLVPPPPPTQPQEPFEEPHLEPFETPTTKLPKETYQDAPATVPSGSVIEPFDGSRYASSLI